MADAYEWQLRLIDQMSAPIKAEVRALTGLEKELKSAEAQMKSFEAQQRSMRKAEAAARGPDATKKLKLAEDIVFARKRQQMLKAQQAEEVRLAKKQAQEHIASQRKQAQMQKKFQEASAKFQADKQAKDLAASTEQIAAIGGVYATAAVAALALGAAIGAITIAGASLAIEASEAKNDTLDMLDAMLGGADAAERTYAAISDVTRDLAVSQRGVQDLASELTAAGVTNEAMLLDAVKSIAQVDSVLKGAGSKIQSIVEKAAQTGKFTINPNQLIGTGVQLSALYQEIAARTGKGVKAVEKELKAGKISAEVGIAALTKVIDSKFGALAGKQALDFGAQVQRLKDNFSKLFENVNTEPLLNALSNIVSLFDTASPSGAALQKVLTGAFDALFRVVSMVAPYVKAFLLGLVIIGLRIAIALKPMLRQFGMLGGQTDGAQSLADAMSEIGVVLAEVTSAVVKFFGYTALWQPLGFAVDMVVGAFRTFFAIESAIVSAGAWLISSIVNIIGWFAELGPSALETGENLVSGLVDGIVGAADRFVDAVKDLAQRGMNAFDEFFQIGSPSKLMKGRGKFLGLGLVEGVDAMAPAANDAMTAMVSPPSVTNNQSSSASSSSIQITIAAGAITIQGAPNMSPGELQDMLTAAIVDVVEQAGLTQGTQPSNAEAA